MNVGPDPLELVPIDKLRSQLEVNLVAPVALTQVRLPGTRTKRSQRLHCSSHARRKYCRKCWSRLHTNKKRLNSHLYFQQHFILFTAKCSPLPPCKCSATQKEECGVQSSVSRGQCTQAFLPLLGTDRSRNGKPGRVIFIGSVYGSYALPWQAAYCELRKARICCAVREGSQLQSIGGFRV